jgi:hypothetical protein
MAVHLALLRLQEPVWVGKKAASLVALRVVLWVKMASE